MSGSAQSGGGSGSATALLVGMFDPLDSQAVAEVARLAQLGRVRVLVLGDSFASGRRLLARSADRVEVVRHVRGVFEAIEVVDAGHLQRLLDIEGLSTPVSWISDLRWAPQLAAVRQIGLEEPALRTTA